MRSPQEISNSTARAKFYTLIWQRTLASQMADAWNDAQPSPRCRFLHENTIVSSRQVAQQSSLKVTEPCSATSLVIQKTTEKEELLPALGESVMLFRYRPARPRVTTPHLLPATEASLVKRQKNPALVDRQRGPQLFRRFKIADTFGRRVKRQLHMDGVRCCWSLRSLR